MKDDRPSIPNSNPTNYRPKAPKPRKVYADGSTYEEITMSKRKYHSIMSLFWLGWALFFGLLFALTFLK